MGRSPFSRREFITDQQAFAFAHYSPCGSMFIVPGKTKNIKSPCQNNILPKQPLIKQITSLSSFQMPLFTVISNVKSYEEIRICDKFIQAKIRPLISYYKFFIHWDDIYRNDKMIEENEIK